MAGEAQNEIWPLPKFYFQVNIDGQIMSFQEASGFEVEVDVTEYRHGDNPNFSTIKMPGMKKYTDITLKKGVFSGDFDLHDWFNEIQLNTIERKTVTISLLNENGAISRFS